MTFSRVPLLFFAGALAAAVAPAQAQTPVQSQNQVIYRCPGKPPEYTNRWTPKEAQERGCTTIEGTPITVFQSTAPSRPRGEAQPPAAAAASGGSPNREARVDPADQRARDTDSRRIYEAELRKEEDKLAELKREFNNGEPERRGDERNYAKYQERVAELKAAIARKEADIAALRRELARLPS